MGKIRLPFKDNYLLYRGVRLNRVWLYTYKKIWISTKEIKFESRSEIQYQYLFVKHMSFLVFYFGVLLLL